MIDKLLHRAFAWTLALCLALAPAIANQSNLWSPTTGTVSGLQLTTNYNNALSAIASCNSGATAPTNDQSAASVYGQCWLNTSVSPNAVQTYDGASWVVVGWIDTTNHYWIANGAGGAGTIASATSTDLGTVKNQVVAITGTTTITSFGSTAPVGARYFLNFTGILTLTHNGTSLILPNGGSNITTAAGDTAIVEQISSGNWRVVSYQRASGAALSSSAVFTGAVFFDGIITPTALVSNTNNWNPSGLSGANTIFLQCNATIKITGIAAPATDGQVLNLINSGSNVCTLAAQDTGSSSGNRFIFQAPITLFSGRTVTLRYMAGAGGWMLWSQVTARPAQGSYKNLRILNVANAMGDTAPGTPNNQNKIILDQIVLDDGFGDAFIIDQSYAYSCTIDITTSGAGGLDTGSVAASTWYYHWVIYNNVTNTASCLDSTSSSSPTLPSGYAFKARVGANRTDASTNKCFYRVQQYGRIAHYVATGPNSGCSADNATGARVFANGTTGTYSSTSPTLASVSITPYVPATAGRLKYFLNQFYQGNNPCNTIVAPNPTAYSGTNNGPNGTNGILGSLFFGTTTSTTATDWIDLDGTNLGVANSSTFGCANAVAGWDDNL